MSEIRYLVQDNQYTFRSALTRLNLDKSQWYPDPCIEPLDAPELIPAGSWECGEGSDWFALSSAVYRHNTEVS